MSFFENLERRVTAITIQLDHAETTGVSTTAKSSYYRSAIILLCSLIEAITFLVVKNRIPGTTKVVKTTKYYSPVLNLSKSALDTSKDLKICEKKEKDLLLENATFGELLIFLKNSTVLDTSEYGLLNSVRIERNKIHMQGVDGQDTGYTKRKFNSLSRALPIIINKL